MAPQFTHGKKAFFSITDIGSSVVDLSSGLESVSQDRSVDTAETTTIGDDDKNFVAGLRSGSFSASGHMSSTHAEALDPLLGSETLTSFVYGPQGTESGKRKYTGQAIVTQLSISSEVSDVVSMSMNLQVTGAVTSTSF